MTLYRLMLISIFYVISPANGFAKKIEEPSPFEFNPILDGAPSTPQSSSRVDWIQGASGLRVSSFTGLSFGSAASYLSPRISSLDIGTFPLFGISFSHRLGAGQTDGLVKRFELGLSTAIGFGRTFEKGDYDDAIDIHLRTYTTVHLLENQDWSLATSLGLHAVAFDNEESEVSQIAVGPYFAPRLTWKTGDLAHIYFEFAWSYLYDFLAYSFREPTVEELEDNPLIVEIKEKGAWFNHYQIIIGLRLLGF